jgi:hypothetical protein
MMNDTARARHFSTYLRERLSHLRLEPHQFARRVGLRQLNRALAWINGTALPPSSRLYAIASVLGVDPIEALLVWMGEPIPEMRGT